MFPYFSTSSNMNEHLFAIPRSRLKLDPPRRPSFSFLRRLSPSFTTGHTDTSLYNYSLFAFTVGVIALAQQTLISQCHIFVPLSNALTSYFSNSIFSLPLASQAYTPPFQYHPRRPQSYLSSVNSGSLHDPPPSPLERKDTVGRSLSFGDQDDWYQFQRSNERSAVTGIQYGLLASPSWYDFAPSSAGNFTPSPAGEGINPLSACPSTRRYPSYSTSNFYSFNFVADTTLSPTPPSAYDSATGITYQPSQLFSRASSLSSLASSPVVFPSMSFRHAFALLSISSPLAPPLNEYHNTLPLSESPPTIARVYQSSFAAMFNVPEHRFTSNLPHVSPSSQSSDLKDGSSPAPFDDHQFTNRSLPPRARTVFPESGSSSNSGVSRRRRPRTPSASNLRPISPITGLPTKILARRSFPPKDAARRRYRCSDCDLAFGRPSALTTHSRLHSGARPFACPMGNCRRPFSVFSNLKRHMSVHPGVHFQGVSVRDLPFLAYDESRNPALYWIDRDTAVMETSQAPRDFEVYYYEEEEEDVP